MLSAFAAFIHRHHFDDWVREFIKAARELDVPLLHLYRDLTEDELFQTIKGRTEPTIIAMGEGRGYEATIANLKAIMENRHPTIEKRHLSPNDAILVYAAQKKSMLRLLTRFTTDPEAIMAVVGEYEDYFIRLQNEAATLTSHLEAETAEQRAREEAEQRAFMAMIVEHTPAAIAFIDEQLVYRVSNPTHQRYIDRKAEEVLGHTVAEVLGERAPAAEHALARVMATGQPLHHRGAAIMTAGEMRYYDYTYFPVTSTAGQTRGVLVMAIDVTPRIEREMLHEERIEALKQADALKDQFLSIISHELRTPINAITGFGTILDDELAGPLSEQQHAYLGKMLAGADVLLSLVNDLLDMSRISAGKFSLSPASADFAMVARDSLAILQPLAEKKGLQLVNAVPPDLPPLVMDAQRISQVLVNLLNNAIKFTEGAGTITLRARPEGESIRCEVEDSGIGIHESDLPKLFKPFVQIEANIKHTARGAGLGLSISRSLVEAHGGAIGVESAPGRGSTFWFTLPLTADAHPEPV